MTRIRDLPHGTLCFDQFDRVCRWYKRIEQISQCQRKDLDPDSQYDEILAFFMNCYHLQDWIMHDISDEQLKNEVKNLIHDNKCFQLCHDICIGAKHLFINNPHFKDDFIIKAGFSVNLGSEYPQTYQIWYITTNSGERLHTFWDIAKPCMEKWIEFFEQYKGQMRS